MIRVRIASLDDVKGIVDTYCSSIDKCFKCINGEKVEVKFKDLSIEDRWGCGGPWMSIETCSIHINYLLVHKQYPLVAEINGRIVGELELYIGYEPGALGKCAFIDVLEVHKSFRRRGIGRALIGKAIDIARSKGCNTIAVWPTKEALGFYKKCGFTDIAFNIVNVEIDLTKNSSSRDSDVVISSLPNDYSLISDMKFITPRIVSSFTAWIKSRWRYIVEEVKLRRYEGSLPSLKAYFVIKSLWCSKDKADLILWIKNLSYLPQILEKVFSTARNLGFKSIRMYVEEDIYKDYVSIYAHRVLSTEVVLMRNIS